MVCTLCITSASHKKSSSPIYRDEKKTQRPFNALYSAVMFMYRISLNSSQAVSLTIYQFNIEIYL